jgi:uncharacterized membrane protein
VQFTVGDKIRVYRQQLPEGAQIGGAPLDPYQFSDFERKTPLLILLGLFAGLVIATARWKGLRALLGLAGSLIVIVFFVALPTLLVFSLAGTPFGEAVNLETVAGEIVATLVGSIGLIAAVPVTTALAALLALRLRPSEVGDVHEHGYAH